MSEKPKDKREFTDIQSIAKSMIDADSERDAMFAELKDIYKMDWAGVPAGYGIENTVAPDCHNTIRGMVDLLVGVRPSIKIPTKPGATGEEENASKIERALGLIQRRFNRVRGSDVVEEATFAAALFGMVVIKYAYVPATAAEIKKQSIGHSVRPEQRKLLKDQVEFYENLAKKSPFMVDVLNPISVHSQRGSEGLRRVVERQVKTVADIRAEWGEHLLLDSGITEEVIYYEYWDRTRYCKWVENTVLDMGENASPSIPYIICDVNGTRIFGRTEYFPVLYPVWKGELWKRLNVVLTMMSSNTFALGNPSFVCTGKSAHDADIPFNMAGSRINLEEGDSISMLTKDLNTTDMQQLYATIRQLVEESTMNKMIFGKPPEHVLAYSTVNMLIQGARHTLMPIQVAIGDALGELFENILLLIVHHKKTLKLFGDGVMSELAPSDIDVDQIEVLVKLKPDIPQDRLQLLNMSTMAVDKGLASKYTARENAGWMDPDQEEERITQEQMIEAIRLVKLMEMQQALAPQGQEPQGQEEGVPPEMATPQELAKHIPPPDDLSGMVGGVPQVMNTGQPNPEFTESAAENMEKQGGY